jgi:hypothetical protein
MGDMTILCYMDVLGYSKVVREHYADKSLVNDLEKIFQSSAGYLKDLKKKSNFADPALDV